MSNEWVSITNLTREYIWENRIRQNLSREFTIEKNLEQEPYRKGQLALFSPLIESFYANKNSPWTQETLIFGQIRGQEYRPLTRDLTSENIALPAEYDFNKRNRLALVCEEPKGIIQRNNSFNIKYFLIPLREGEYVSEKHPEAYGSLPGLQLFESLFHFGKIDISEIPIEVIKRPGEINKNELLNEHYSLGLHG